MKLLDLYLTVPPEKVVEAFEELYPGDEITLDFYRNVFLTLIITRGTVDRGRLLAINHFQTFHDDPCDDDDSYDVTLLVPRSELTIEEESYLHEGDYQFIDGKEYACYGMSFIPWDELLGCEVVSLSDVPLTLAQQVAHVFYEMTWHGMESESQEKKNMVQESVDKLNCALDEHKIEIEAGRADEGSFPSCLKSFDIDNFITDDMRERVKIRRDNGLTMRIFKNGIQTWPKPKH